ncbi:MAG: hypothetical protein R2940_00380 [Syntrophotaleaceae bacterium]
MTDRNASSYNLQDAKKILATLLPKNQKKPQEEELRESHGYVRLSQKIAVRPDRTPMPEPAVAKEEAGLDEQLPMPEKFTSWEDCISWCMQATRAEAAFVVDSQGFIIAVRGRAPSHGFECTGAELVYSMDQLERIDPEAGKLNWIDLDYNKRRVVGFVTPQEEGEYFIIGMISPDSSYNTRRHSISRLILASLGTIN